MPSESDSAFVRRRPRSSSSAYDRLRAAIIDGEFEPGVPLVEGRLAEWCGVSRTPVREALLRLEVDGLVERRDGIVQVRTLTPDETLSAYHVRIVLEKEASRLAAERHTDFDRIEMQRTCRRFEEVDPADTAEIIRRNRDFHQAIWRATGNSILVDHLTRLNLLLAPQAINTLAHSGRVTEAIEEHRAIVDAVVGHDADAAAEAAAEHFRRARDIKLEIWAMGGSARESSTTE